MTDMITAAPDDAELSLTEVAATDADIDMAKLESFGLTLEAITSATLARRRMRRAFRAAREAMQAREAAM